MTKQIVTTKTVTRTEYHINWADLATAVEALVMEKLKGDLEDWKGDRSMISMFLCDAGDGIKVCELLAEGDWPAVDKQLWSMDTAARDYLYHFIKQVAGQDFLKIVNGHVDGEIVRR